MDISLQEIGTLRELEESLWRAEVRFSRERVSAMLHEREALRSSIWTRSNGAWQLRFHQGTLVRGPR